MKLLFSVLYIALSLVALAHGLCPDARTQLCEDNVAYACCVREGQTKCTCTKTGWKSKNQYTPGKGCPSEDLKTCSNQVAYNGCCGKTYLDKCDIKADTGNCHD